MVCHDKGELASKMVKPQATVLFRARTASGMSRAELSQVRRYITSGVMLNTINSRRFACEVAQMCGYDTALMVEKLVE
jgi:hypothetical protein